MPRTQRVAPGGIVFHVLNRGVGRQKAFASQREYDAPAPAFNPRLVMLGLYLDDPGFSRLRQIKWQIKGSKRQIKAANKGVKQIKGSGAYIAPPAQLE